MFENERQLAQIIDSALLRPDATLADWAAACEEAKRYGLAALIVNSCHVARTKTALAGSGVKVGAVVGFPFGASTTTVKIVEAMEAMKNGVDELDIVVNIGLIKSGRLDLAEIDIKNIIVLTKNVVHKVILETGFLTADEITAVARIAAAGGAEFVKTSTGFGPRGATIEDVTLMREALGQSCRIKASGGIRDLAAVEAMVSAGADRVGTSSAAAIIEEFRRRSGH